VIIEKPWLKRAAPNYFYDAAGSACFERITRLPEYEDEAVREAAYDDVAGVTAAFNLNVLQHTNRLLGAHFQPRAVAASRFLQSPEVTHRDALGSIAGNAGSVAEWLPELPPRRAHPHREQLQGPN
jgi:uncharacterized SAM-dependent methyltransferase